VTEALERVWCCIGRMTVAHVKYSLLILVSEAFNTSNCVADLAIVALNICR